jgi:hypothetical protein
VVLGFMWRSSIPQFVGGGFRLACAVEFDWGSHCSTKGSPLLHGDRGALVGPVCGEESILLHSSSLVAMAAVRETRKQPILDPRSEEVGDAVAVCVPLKHFELDISRRGQSIEQNHSKFQTSRGGLKYPKLRKRRLTLVPGAADKVERPICRKELDQGIRDKSINWMEATMRSTWRPGDCSEVLLNYLDGGKGVTGRNRLKLDDEAAVRPKVPGERLA